MKLKRCPFCGSKDLSIMGKVSVYIICNTCASSTGRYTDEESIIQAWNTRYKKKKTKKKYIVSTGALRKIRLPEITSSTPNVFMFMMPPDYRLPLDPDWNKKTTDSGPNLKFYIKTICDNGSVSYVWKPYNFELIISDEYFVVEV